MFHTTRMLLCVNGAQSCSKQPGERSQITRMAYSPNVRPEPTKNPDPVSFEVNIRPNLGPHLAREAFKEPGMSALLKEAVKSRMHSAMISHFVFSALLAPYKLCLRAIWRTAADRRPTLRQIS